MNYFKVLSYVLRPWMETRIRSVRIAGRESNRSSIIRSRAGIFVTVDYHTRMVAVATSRAMTFIPGLNQIGKTFQKSHITRLVPFGNLVIKESEPCSFTNLWNDQTARTHEVSVLLYLTFWGPSLIFDNSRRWNIGGAAQEFLTGHVTNPTTNHSASLTVMKKAAHLKVWSYWHTVLTFEVSLTKLRVSQGNRPWRPMGLWDVEAPTFCLDNRLTNGGKVVSLTHRPPFTCRTWYSFLLEAESTPGHSAAGRIWSIEKIPWPHLESNLLLSSL
jgi:hypothetical protein